MRYDQGMTTRVLRTFLVCALVLLACPASARADITGFLGVTTTPSNRPAVGFALGAGLVIFGAEFEYAHSSEDLPELAPSLRTFMFNGLLQTPIPIAGIQFYGEAGGGVYHESLTNIRESETNFAVNVGGGAKISLIGPLRLRVDYRVFNLKGSPLHSNVQRIYAGLNLKF
jgi:opacity protein-like surface antigen